LLNNIGFFGIWRANRDSDEELPRAIVLNLYVAAKNSLDLSLVDALIEKSGDLPVTARLKL
jgi:hypothetical protein